MEVERLGVGDIAARSYVGDRVARDIDDVIYYGSVTSFDEEKKIWTVAFDDGDCLTMDYVQLVEAKQLSDTSA